MSRYSHGYGQWPASAPYLPYSQPPQPPPPQTQHQPPANQNAPAPNEYSPSDPAAASRYSASQAAFAFNATQIPGLGISGGATPSGPSGAWAPPQSYSGYGQPQIQSSKRSQPPQPQPPQPVSVPVTAPKPTALSQDAMEEGELADEYFDDLYEPQATDSAKPAYSPSGRNGNTPKKLAQNETRDAQDEAFYEAEPGEVVSNRGGSPGRERSGSYSPYLSPREIDLEAGTSRDASDAEATRIRQAPRNHTAPQPGKRAANGVNSPKVLASAQPTAPPPPAAPTAAELPFKSAAEAKKEAQKSILRLLPLGVKLQNYIDEGFDENIVKSLFGDLNLLPAGAPAKSAVENDKGQKQATPELSTSTAATKAKDQTEERKDRIARLLAAKAAKAATAAAASTTPPAAPPPKAAVPAAPAASSLNRQSVGSEPSATQNLPPPSAPTAPAAMQKQQPPPSAPTGPAALQKLPPPSAPTAPAALRRDAAPPVAKAKSKTDKEMLLKKKMEALLKAREVQSQQSSAATNSDPKPPTLNTLDTANDVNKTANIALPPKPQVTVNASVPEASTSAISSTTPLTSTSRNFASPSPMSAKPDLSIPGLYLSTSNGSLQAPTQTSRKRPVAADFVDYSSSVGAPKRPFGQNRQDSFVIDISDEESDEDVEMEVDSPGARSPSGSNHHNGTPGRKGPSIKDFPPLSDGRPKRPLSRTSSNGPHAANLQQLHGEISSMQRKIAELEARKARKIGSGAQTPDVTTGTPPELKQPNNEPATGPKENEQQAHPPSQRAVSSSDVDSTDLPSAQLISEAASAGLPKRPEPPKKQGQAKPGYGQLSAEPVPRAARLPGRSESSTVDVGSDGDRRTRIASYHLPKVEATLLEKQTKLKLLEQKTAQLRREIEKEAAEKKKLVKELHRLESEPTQPDAQPEPPGSDSQDVSRLPSEQDPPSNSPQAQADQRRGSAAPVLERPESLKEAPPSAEGDGHDKPGAPMSPRRGDTVGTEPMELDDDAGATEFPTAPFTVPPTARPTDTAEVSFPLAVPESSTAVTSGASPTVAAEPAPPTELDTAPTEPAPATELDTASKQPSQPPEVGMETHTVASTPESGQIDESDPEPPTHIENQLLAQPDRRAIEESQQRGNGADPGELTEGSPVPVMISDVTQASRQGTEEAQDAVDGEVSARPAPAQLSSFTPYESPLKFFRSYRFHPEYAHTVRGGLRSLTYTNKIDHEQALCPNELLQKQCNDKDCGFQHFASIVPRDEQILIELGRADEFAEGEEKNKFIGGLRDVLAKFRAAKVRDYDQIGYGIIEYRRRFIGDNSRVLNGLHDTKI